MDALLCLGVTMVEKRHCPKLFLSTEWIDSLVPAVSTLLEMTNRDVSTTDWGLSTRTAMEISPILAATQRSLGYRFMDDYIHCIRALIMYANSEPYT